MIRNWLKQPQNNKTFSVFWDIKKNKFANLHFIVLLAELDPNSTCFYTCFVSCSPWGVPGHIHLHRVGAPCVGGLWHPTVLQLLLLALCLWRRLLQLELQAGWLKGIHRGKATIYIHTHAAPNPQLCQHRWTCKMYRNKKLFNFIEALMSELLSPPSSYLQLFQRKRSNKSLCTIFPRADSRQTKDGNNFWNNRAFTGWKHLSLSHKKSQRSHFLLSA